MGVDPWRTGAAAELTFTADELKNYGRSLLHDVSQKWPRYLDYYVAHLVYVLLIKVQCVTYGLIYNCVRAIL